MFNVRKSGLLQLNSGALKVKESIDFLRKIVQALNSSQPVDLSGVVERANDTDMLTDNRVTREFLRILLLTDDDSCKQVIVDYLLRHHMHVDLDPPILSLLPLWAPKHRDTLLTFLSALTGSQQDMAFLAITDLLSHCTLKHLEYDSTYFLTRALRVMGQNIILTTAIETSLLFEFANIASDRRSMSKNNVNGDDLTTSKQSTQGKKHAELVFITMSTLFWQLMEFLIYNVVEVSVPELVGICTSYANSSYMPTYSLVYLTLQPFEQRKDTRTPKGHASDEHIPILQITGTKTTMSWSDYINFWNHFLSNSTGDAVENLMNTLSSLVLLAHKLVSQPQFYPDIVSSKQTERSIFFSLELLLIIASVSDRIFSILVPQKQQYRNNDVQSKHVVQEKYSKADLSVAVLTAFEKILNGLVSIAKNFPDNVPEAFVDCYNSVLVKFFYTLVSHIKWSKINSNMHHEKSDKIKLLFTCCIERIVTLFDAFSRSLHVKAIHEIFECLYDLITPLPAAFLAIHRLHTAIVSLYLVVLKYSIKTYDFNALNDILLHIIGASDTSLIFTTKIVLMEENSPVYSSVDDSILDCIFPMDHGAFGRLLSLLLQIMEKYVSVDAMVKRNMQYITFTILAYFNYGGVCLQTSSFKQAVSELLNKLNNTLTDDTPQYIYVLYDSIIAVMQPGVHLVSSKWSFQSRGDYDRKHKEHNKSMTLPVTISSIERYSKEIVHSLINTKTFTLSSPNKKEIQQHTEQLLRKEYRSEHKPPTDSIYILHLYVALQVKSKSNYSFIRTTLSRTSLYSILKASLESPELILLCYEWSAIFSYAAWYSARAATIVNLGLGAFDGPTFDNDLCKLVLSLQSGKEAIGLNEGYYNILKSAYALSLENSSVFLYPIDKLFILLLQTAVMSPNIIPLSELLVYRTFNTAVEMVGSEVLRLLMLSGLSVDTLLTYCTSHFKDSPLLVAFCLIAAVYSLQVAPRPVRIKIPRTQGVMFATAFLRKDQLEILRGIVKE